MKTIICRKCAGKGTIPNYKHVEDGICFTCHGSGVEEVADDVTDTVKEIRETRAKEKEDRKAFEALYKPYEQEISRLSHWMWYILRETKDIEEQLKRLDKYIAFKAEKEEYKKSIDMNTIDIDEAMQYIKEIESKYFKED
jgi:predicted  nucleic acid-binding Zn-ribbon protein